MLSFQAPFTPQPELNSSSPFQADDLARSMMATNEKLRALQEMQELKAKVATFARKYNALKRENEQLKARLHPLEAQAQTMQQLKDHLQDVKNKLSIEQRKRLALQASLAQSREMRWTVAAVPDDTDETTQTENAAAEQNESTTPNAELIRAIISGEDRPGAEADIEAFQAAAAANLAVVTAARQRQQEAERVVDARKRQHSSAMQRAQQNAAGAVLLPTS